jgi:hypothetical protein
VISKRVDDLVGREVDAAGTPKRHPKSVVNKAVNSKVPVRKIRIVESDDESDDDVPLVEPVKGEMELISRLSELLRMDRTFVLMNIIY